MSLWLVLVFWFFSTCLEDRVFLGPENSEANSLIAVREGIRGRRSVLLKVLRVVYGPTEIKNNIKCLNTARLVQHLISVFLSNEVIEDKSFILEVLKVLKDHPSSVSNLRL